MSTDYDVVAVPDGTAWNIRKYLREHPEHKQDRYGGLPGLDGHCYHAAEAYYHAKGGYEECPLSIHCLSHESGTHWFLRDGTTVIDLTVANVTPDLPYLEPPARGFMSRQPSNRAAQILDALPTDPEVVL